MNNSINFTGTFRIMSPNEQTKNDLRVILQKKSPKNTFHNYHNTKDSIYILNNNADKSVAKYVLDKKLDFVYYPNIEPQDLQGMINQKKVRELFASRKKTQGKVETLAKLRQLFPSTQNINKTYNYNAAIYRTFAALDMDPNEYNILKVRGVSLVKSKQNGKVIARIAPLSKFGITYAHIEPPITDLPPRRYAIDQNCNIVHEYKSLSGAKQFKENFAKAVEFNK